MVEDWQLALLEGVGGYVREGKAGVQYYRIAREDKAFLVLRANTIEVRCDGRLAKLLKEKYESVMQSRYFGQGGIEVVRSGQLDDGELRDLVRLSYDLTARKKEKNVPT